jgi:hypothetical protein
MAPSRLRLLALLALAVPILMSAVAAGSSAGFGALALASAAGALAMLLAGSLFRVILAVLIALLGVCVLLVGAVTPQPDALVVVAFVGGAIQILVAGWVATTVRHWPAATTRYSRSRLEGNPATDWDALSAGDDPTEAP